MTPIVRMDHVSVVYGDRSAVDDVTLDVEPGEWLTIVGPNGAGKSSLLRTVVGERPASGAVRIGGHPITGLRGRQRARLVAYVPQSPTFPPGMSVFDYALLGRTPHMGALAAESGEDISEVWAALDALDLIEFADRDVGTLSGGETQRVAMARVLAQDAPVLVLDEATASLDVARQHQVLELVDAVRSHRRLAVLTAMHDLTAAAQFSDRVAVIDRGRIRMVGEPRTVLTEELLRDVYEPSVRVIDVDGSTVIVSMRMTEREGAGSPDSGTEG